MAESTQPSIYARTKFVQIEFYEDRTPVPCVLKAFSETGAVLYVHAPVAIPNTFRLALGRGQVRRCWVISRAARQITVAFTDWEPQESISLRAQDAR